MFPSLKAELNMHLSFVIILFLVILYGDSSVNISFLNFTAEVPLHPLSIFLCFAHTLNPENVVFLFTL